ncbi:MAG TPA: Gfo/Idh/MocA family oxidoreductase [Acidimicrobiales bacterium]|nr:Gfo/Idh/MocA family oxidoreductase [Acidimicrobiales bacterium]
MRVVLVGAGAVGARAARQLHSVDGLDSLAVVDADRARAEAVAGSLGVPAAPAGFDEAVAGADVVVLTQPRGHRPAAERALEHGAHVVSVADDVEEVRGLLALDVEARERALSVVVGAGFSPGLTCLLARHAADDFDAVDEVHVAKAGTGGPACATRHHRALSEPSVDWRDGTWVTRRGGSGRELCWFPDPVGPRDCYRAGLAEALLLAPAFVGVQRVTARVAASRRDRISAHLPMLRPPHPEGLVGAVRVEVRGRRGGTRDVRVLGALDRPATGAGAVAALAAAWAVNGDLARPGAAGLAELVGDSVPFLAELARRGVRAAVFEGAAASFSTA